MSPLFWIKAVILLVLAGVIWYAKYDYDEGKREEGREEIRVEVAKETLRKSKAWERQADENDARAKALDPKRAAVFSNLRKNLAAVPPGSDSSVYHLLFNDSRKAAESSRVTLNPPEATPAPASSTEALVGQLYEWADTAIRRDEEWRSFYNSLRNTK